LLAKQSIPIPRQLKAADIAISSALSNADILKRLTDGGYSADRIHQGQDLYQEALLAVRSYTELVQAKADREASADKAARNAHQAYLSLAQTFRKIWPEDKEQLLILGIPAQPPQATAGFLSAAAVLFDAPLNDPELMDLLAALGYPRLLLESERAKIKALEELVREDENSEEAIRDADREQQQALKALNDWMDRFIKKARVALQNKKDHLERMGLLERSPKDEAPKRAQPPRQAKRG
jgi:hypothetical protein